jgi:hypothetical protein
MFLTAPGPSMILNGAEIGINRIAVGDAGDTYTSRLLGPTQWGAVSLSRKIWTLFQCRKITAAPNDRAA